ncbi:unnamed protein product [Cylicostephanus goldi]|uniref:Uncharacterized protein n=1 Tax=Cylicostephanus goldi TaxID=71465 RepID=A0A3P7QC15_CYLGO|nr:unnamed protein product [Cylicostephanus goldi]
MTDVVETKVRAPTMTPEELCIISEFYAEHYDVFHSTLSGSSRQPKVKEKKEKLQELSKILSSSGYPTRTTMQLDQRIRDTMKKTKFFAAKEREEKTMTGGGIPPRYPIPAHVRILLDKLGNKPRVKGLSFGKEVCGVENESNVNQSLPTKRRAEEDTDPYVTDNDEDLELNDSFHSDKLTLKKVKSEPHYISRNFEDQQYRETDTKLQSIVRQKENVPEPHYISRKVEDQPYRY